MLKHVLWLTPFALALAACATNTDSSAVDWSRPYQPLTGAPPVFLHDMAIANPPYPRDAYAEWWDEPTRFEFRPHNVIYDEPTDDGTGGADEGFDGGGYDMGGGE